MLQRLIGICIILASSLAPADAGSADAVLTNIPLSTRPVRVEVAAYVMDLLSIDEKDQTFQAEVLFNFRWKDPRLAKPGTAPVRLIEDEMDERLKTMWSPDLEFVNGIASTIFNRALTIYPDGTVEQRMDVLGTYSSVMDFRRFPFDKQVLRIAIESFMEKVDQLEFVPQLERTRAESDTAGGDFQLIAVRPAITRSAVKGWDEDFSRYELGLTVERDVSFYVWRVIIPTAIIVLISFALFFVDISSYHDRVSIAMTCLLACVATQFAISFSLPRIGYLTPLDRFFVWTYIAIGIGVAISTLVKILEHRADARWRFVDFHARWVSPLIFFAGIAVVLVY